MTKDSGALSIDFIAGFTIFLIALIWVMTLVPGLLINLQGFTIDYDAVAYRTGVILAEDPGEPPSWEVAPYQQDFNKNDVLRFGLAVSRDDPNILSLEKVDRFFDTTLFNSTDYHNKAIFGDYPYTFNISLRYVGSNESVGSIGSVLPEGYGYIRRFVKIKSMSNTTIDGNSIATQNNYVHGDNETTHIFSVHLNNSYLIGSESPIKDPAYQINPGQDSFMINLTNLNSTMYSTGLDDRRGCFDIQLNSIQVYDGNPDDTTNTKWLQFKNPIIDEVQYNTIVPQTVKNNVTIIYNSPENRNGINWQAADIYIFFIFNLNKTGVCPYAGSQFLNNTVLSPFRVTSPFLYDYNPANVTQPQLSDAVLDVAVWSGANTGVTGPGPTLNIPVVSFTGTPVNGNTPLTVQFTDGSTNTPTSWSWNFGDGGTASSKNPSHIYNAAGIYSVTLTATNAAGSGTLTRTNYIIVTSAGPTFGSINPTAGPLAGGTTVTITGTGFTGATAVTFGGTAATSFTVNTATQITATTPAHATGAVNVVITTPAGTATGTNAYTYVPPLVADFSYTQGAPGQHRITVTDTSTGGSPTYAVTRDWNWGDASAHGSGSPTSHDYASSGSKTVTLTVTRTIDGATSTITKSITAP
jgi:PKD repeat protein